MPCLLLLCYTRYAAFSTNKGRVLSWGFKDVPGSTKAAVEAPVPGAYVAAFRGFEGKPAPVAKKRCGECRAWNFGGDSVLKLLL